MLSARLKLWLASATVIAITIGSGLYRYRERQMDRLYAEAAGDPSSFRGTEEAKTAVRKLGTYRGDRSTTMLLEIALGRTPLVWPDVQREAVRALASRGDSNISADLASQLQPHVPLPTRQAVADALLALPCSGECVRAILQYLYRVWQGEPNYEDRSVFPPGLDEEVKADLAKQQEALYRTLYLVLKHQANSTIEALYRIYGLGTSAPSNFGLVLVSRMQLTEACPSVIQSENLVSKSPAESFRAPREEIEKSVGALNCR